AVSTHLPTSIAPTLTLFLFNAPPPPPLSPLSLHDALPISTAPSELAVASPAARAPEHSSPAREDKLSSRAASSRPTVPPQLALLAFRKSNLHTASSSAPLPSSAAQTRAEFRRSASAPHSKENSHSIPPHAQGIES